MVAECLIFIASFYVQDLPTATEMNEVKVCLEEIPTALYDDIPYLVEFFEEENLYTALRIAWCESRGKSTAYRSSADDSGIFQFIPRTWRWIYEMYGVPEWGTWVIMRFGRPHLEADTVYKTDFGLEFLPVQYSPYWNIKAASHLAEDIYGKTRWDDWNSSRWCWEDEKKWREKWKSEN